MVRVIHFVATSAVLLAELLILGYVGLATTFINEHAHEIAAAGIALGAHLAAIGIAQFASWRYWNFGSVTTR